MGDSEDDIETEISEIGRDLKIMEHRYASNLAFLHAQTKELENYYHFMVLEE